MLRATCVLADRANPGNSTAPVLPAPWAVPYALGFSLFPVQARSKMPVGKWKAYQTTRATPDVVLGWAKRQSNIGIATGVVSGLIVLDLDSAESIADAERRGIPDTITVRTSKGMHVYFAHPGDVIGNRAGVLPGVDIRGDGGYVVAPGSTHESGFVYAWDNPPGLFDLAPMPTWLRELLAKPEAANDRNAPKLVGRSMAYGEAALDREIAQLAQTGEGGRNHALNKAAFALAQLAAGGEINGSQAQHKLRTTAAGLGLSASEIEKTVTSAWQAGTASPRSKPEADKRGTNKNPYVPPSRAAKKITRARLLGCLHSLAVRLRHDSFADEPQMSSNNGPWSPLCNGALRRLWSDSETPLTFLPAQSVFTELALDEADRNKFDPLDTYLKALEWDGVGRLSRFLSDYFGADDTPLHAEFGSRTLIGAVRRAVQPGVKHDTMLVLEGPQGARKSSAVAALCPNPSWFTDCLKLDAEPREVIEQSAGKWIVEVAELGGMRKADVDNLKATLSRQSDKARRAYGRQTEERQRRFMLFGTVNPGANGYLKDGTGNRRFWICPVGTIDLDAIARDRDQLWAEAMHRHRLGEPNWLADEFAVDAEAIADERREDVPWADTLRGRLEDLDEITATSALGLIGVPVERQDRSVQMQVADALKEIGFRRGNKQGNKPRIWRRQ